MDKWIRKYSQPLFLSIVLLLMVLFLSAKSEYFLTWENLRNIPEAASYRLVLAIGMTFVVASGAMDLSAGSIVSLCGIVIALAMHAGFGIALSVCIGLTMGLLLGALNGLLIHFTKINFFVLTLATGGMLRGISLMITGGKPITKFGATFMQLGIGRFFDVQYAVYFAVALALVAFPLMFHMKWGNYIQALGGSQTALRRAGVRTGFYRVSVHVFLGLTAAVSALIIMARLNSAEPNAGLGMELDAITAVIMGGTPIRGGRASLGGTILAVVILATIRNGLTLLSIPADFQQWITGFLLLVSVLISEIKVGTWKL